MASTSNIEIMERFQSKALRLITDAPWYVPNVVIRNDLQIPTIKEEITLLSSKYSAGLNTHPNHLVPHLSNPPAFRRLRKLLPSNLPYRFTQNAQILTIKEEITRLSSKYSAGLNTHPNHLVTQLSNPPAFRRLRKLLPPNLPYRFTDSLKTHRF
jgi:hypothetical protein